MTELEQRLTNEFGKLAEQYEQDQKRLAGQVERLEEQVRQLAEQYAEAQKQYAAWVDLTNLLAQDHQKMGEHVTKLTDAYDDQAQEIRRSDQSLQRARGGFDRTLSVIHAEAEQKRKQGDRWDRVEGRIESLIQDRVRSRDRGGPEL